jgi:hypothetical protein
MRIPEGTKWLVSENAGWRKCTARVVEENPRFILATTTGRNFLVLRETGVECNWGIQYRPCDEAEARSVYLAIRSHMVEMGASEDYLAMYDAGMEMKP